MKKINARVLAAVPTEQLWEILTGPICVVFDDGEVETNAKDVLYSHYAWNTFHHHYPEMPMLKKHLASVVIGDGRLGAKTHMSLLRNVMWSAYDTYLNKPFPNPLNNWIPEEISEIMMRNHLSRMIYETTNLMYNDLSYKLEEWVTSLDILDFIEVIDHPRIKEANENAEPTQQGIEAAYSVVRDVLLGGTELPHNPLSLAARSNLVNMGQLLQCVSHRGFLTDIDSNQFPVPVMRSYVQGIRSIYDSLIESRSASKSLAFTKAPLQESEYFSRRLQLVSLVLSNLHRGDCGTTKYLPWIVQDKLIENGVKRREGDLNYLDGKYYLDETTNQLKMIKSSDKHLIGKSLKIRSILHCAHPDPYGICTTCFGELSLAVPYGTNVGHMASSSMAQDTSQNVMSTKHLDSNVIIEGITLYDENRNYLKVSADGNSYLLADKTKGKKIALIISNNNAPNMTDVIEVDDVRNLNISRISEIAQMTMHIVSAKTEEYAGLDVNKKERKASMTYELLEHIRKYGWKFDENNNYVIDMANWDWNKPILSLPMRHENMSDHAKAISEIVESSIKNKRSRDTMLSADATLVDLFNLVNEKLNVNLAVLEVVLYTAMVTDAENDDYSTPKPWTRSSLGTMRSTMAGRSLSAVMAFEHHRDLLYSPDSFINTNRQSHPFDWLVLPAEVEKFGQDDVGYKT